MGFKHILAKLICYSGLPYLVRELVQRRYVTILVLHDPVPVKAEQIFRWMMRHYQIISLEQYLDYCQGKSRSLPGKAMIITLDDGHAGNYGLLPFLRETGMPLTIFLCAGIVNTSRHFWFKYKGLKRPSDYYKRLADTQRLRELADCGFQEEKSYTEPQALNKMQIGEMKPFVDFESHTLFHPCLHRCNEQKSWYEIATSKDILNQDFNLAIRAIAFPNGDYGDREIGFARAAGYQCAVTCDTGYNSRDSDLFRLRRFGVQDHDTIELAALKACGIWDVVKKAADFSWLFHRRKADPRREPMHFNQLDPATP